MEYQGFYEWLLSEHNMGERSAKDNLSRLRRVLSLTQTKKCTKNTMELLSQSKEFDNCSMYVKSQLKRTVTLYQEFMKAK